MAEPMQEEQVSMTGINCTEEVSQLPNKFKLLFKKFYHLDYALDFLIKLHQRTPKVSVLKSHFRSINH